MERSWHWVDSLSSGAQTTGGRLMKSRHPFLPIYRKISKRQRELDISLNYIKQLRLKDDVPLALHQTL